MSAGPAKPPDTDKEGAATGLDYAEQEAAQAAAKVTPHHSAI